MTENAKTGLFGLAAIVVAVASFVVTRPTQLSTGAPEEVGKVLYPDFKDPLSAGSLEIYSYDRVTATPLDFKVALVNGRWVIPSHESYPSDAETQLPIAAASVMDLKILEVKSVTAKDFEQYGVLDPDPTKNEIKSGSEGVGIKVALDDKTGKEIMRLIIGKEDPTQPGVRFVRPAGRELVYATKIDTSKLSTKFEDWIEPDLLKVNAYDIVTVDLDNYSIDEAAGGIKDGERLALKYDDAATDKKWTLADLKEGETLNDARLDEMKDALDDLRIVDVRRKPTELSAELKTKEGMTLNEEALRSLQQRGFFITREGTLVSNEGDAVVGTKEGIEYVMRFGEIAAETSSTNPAEKPAEGDEAKAKGQNRYIFITAQFNKDRIEPPTLQPLPGEAPAETPAAETAPAEGDAATEAPAADAAGGAAEPQPAGACQVADPAASADEPAAEAAPAANAELPPADNVDAPAADATALSPDQVAVDAARQKIEAENQRAQSLYDQKVTDGEKKAMELNERFADWYYVISDDIYKKIKVNRVDILKVADPLTDPANPVEQFETLREAVPTAPEGDAPATQE